jgi:hypothetical protein
MFQFFRNLFRELTRELTLEEMYAREQREASNIYQEARREAFNWAKNPIGAEFSIYVGVLNNRVKNRVADNVREAICEKYNCYYSFTRNERLHFHTEYNTEKLINADRA